jgi:hypothetical protein
MKDLKHSVGSIKAQSYTGSTDKSASQIEKGQIYKQIRIVNKITSVNM